MKYYTDGYGVWRVRENGSVQIDDGGRWEDSIFTNVHELNQDMTIREIPNPETEGVEVS